MKRTQSNILQGGLRRWLLATTLVCILLLPGAAQASTDLAGSQECVQIEAAAVTPEADTYDRVCGKLVFLIDINTKKGLLGFSPCGSGGGVLIFSQRPRDLYQYYQFKNLKVVRGSVIETDRGRVRRYITGFHSYIPINDCSQCGVNLQATQWSKSTQAASFLFPTPSPATLTAAAAASLTPGATFTYTPTLPPSATPTATYTASATPEPSATATATLTLAPPSATPQPSPTPAPPARASTSGWLLPVLGLLLLLALGVAFFFLRRQQR
ncbi:MAG: hypothetical protein AB1894_04140 [Chloroflexota bacterium]